MTQADVITGQDDWYIDVNIGGANPDLGTSSISDYANGQIENASLDMVVNSGSASAGIPCSSTNENNIGDLTCSSGNESVGVIFNYVGRVKACASFGHFGDMDATGTISTYFQLVKTPNNAQTIDAEGNQRIASSPQASASIADVSTNGLRVCGKFSVNGKTTLRMFYEQVTAATISNNILLADRNASNGQRDIHWSVDPVKKFVAASLKDVMKTPSTTQNKQLVLVSAEISATEVVTEEDDDFLTTCTDADPSVCTFTGSYWTDDPKCWANPVTSGAIAGVTVDTTTSATIDRTDASTIFKLFCTGRKN